MQTLSPCQACDIRDLGMCSVLQPKELDKLNAIVTQVTINARRTLFYEGDPAENVFNVTSGCMRLSKMLPDGRLQVTGFLMPGDFLGLAYLETYSYTAEAVGPATLCRFQRTRLEGLFAELPELEKRLLGIAFNDVSAAQDHMLLLGRKTPDEKVATFLLGLVERAEANNVNPPGIIALPMDRNDIAGYLGLTIETVSRTFTRLRKCDLIALSSRSEVVLLDRPGLRMLATGE